MRFKWNRPGGVTPQATRIFCAAASRLWRSWRDVFWGYIKQRKWAFQNNSSFCKNGLGYFERPPEGHQRRGYRSKNKSHHYHKDADTSLFPASKNLFRETDRRNYAFLPSTTFVFLRIRLKYAEQPVLAKSLQSAGVEDFFDRDDDFLDTERFQNKFIVMLAREIHDL